MQVDGWTYTFKPEAIEARDAAGRPRWTASIPIDDLAKGAGVPPGFLGDWHVRYDPAPLGVG